jgi:hypothetical protein
MLLLHMPLTNNDMLKILESTDFPKNKGRTNNLQPGQTYSESMVLGKVRQLYTSCDGKICKVDATKNKKFPIYETLYGRTTSRLQEDQICIINTKEQCFHWEFAMYGRITRITW